MRAELGIVETLGLIGSLVLAVPVGVAGVELLLGGRAALGATLLAVAALMVVVPRRITAPSDLPGEVAARIADRVVLDPDATGARTDGNGEGDGDGAAGRDAGAGDGDRPSPADGDGRR
ncbi:MAG: hypothetical protein ABEH40_09135 [Haloferacaceae archaeon]